MALTITNKKYGQLSLRQLGFLLVDYYGPCFVSFTTKACAFMRCLVELQRCTHYYYGIKLKQN